MTMAAEHSITLSVFGMAMGFLYGWIMNLFSLPDISGRPYTVAAAYVSSFFFELGHGTCTAMVLWLVGKHGYGSCADQENLG
ncbi:MAG: hypothetical protein ACLTI1_06625 [Clostridia bacterium]